MRCEGQPNIGRNNPAIHLIAAQLPAKYILEVALKVFYILDTAQINEYND